MLQASWLLGEDSIGKGGGTGGSQDAAFNGKGGGEKEEEGKRTLKKLCEMVAAADLGLQSEEEKSVPTELPSPQDLAYPFQFPQVIPSGPCSLPPPSPGEF